MTPDQRAAVKRFAKEKGPYWKQALRGLWLNDKPHPDRALLQQVRNELGPLWLTKVKVSEL